MTSRLQRTLLWLNAAAMPGSLTYTQIFVRSLWVLPLVIAVGIWSPLLDHRPWLQVGGFAVSRGWASFIMFALRALAFVQVALLLLQLLGYYGLCRLLRRCHVPQLFVTQLLLLFRYLFVLLSEAGSMHDARLLRTGGRGRLPLVLWGVLIGQLLLRSADRSERIYQSMNLRGYPS